MNTCILILVEHFGSKKGLALGASFMIMAIGGIVAPQIVCGLLSHVSHNGYSISVGSYNQVGLSHWLNLTCCENATKFEKSPVFVCRFKSQPS